MGYMYLHPTSVSCTQCGLVAPNVASFPGPIWKIKKGAGTTSVDKFWKHQPEKQAIIERTLTQDGRSFSFLQEEVLPHLQEITGQAKLESAVYTCRGHCKRFPHHLPALARVSINQNILSETEKKLCLAGYVTMIVS